MRDSKFIMCLLLFLFNFCLNMYNNYYVFFFGFYVMKKKSTEKMMRVNVTMTEEEFNIVHRVAEIEGKPVAAVFMRFVRDAKVFGVLAKVLKAMEMVVKVKSVFKKRSKDIDSEIVDLKS